jgi:hypothetical protein
VDEAARRSRSRKRANARLGAIRTCRIRRQIGRKVRLRSDLGNLLGNAPSLPSERWHRTRRQRLGHGSPGWTTRPLAGSSGVQVASAASNRAAPQPSCADSLGSHHEAPTLRQLRWSANAKQIRSRDAALLRKERCCGTRTRDARTRGKEEGDGSRAVSCGMRRSAKARKRVSQTAA